ncbi:MAG: hypothetical protein JW715_00870 [Sedimentisphaerales bacterium]|nr:hypothetical protein [Sedimentisphaerales bacterium]
MKNIHKNPILYYIAIPIIVALWPLLVWAMYLPNARTDLDRMITQYQIKAEPLMIEILSLDPIRLGPVDPNQEKEEFTYYQAVDKAASSCRIPPSKCKLETTAVQASGGQKSQSAYVKLTQVDITTFARFLSAIQLRWPNLQCTKVNLDKKEGFPDMWEISIDFKYYY